MVYIMDDTDSNATPAEAIERIQVPTNEEQNVVMMDEGMKERSGGVVEGVRAQWRGFIDNV